jgi:hypothetical protein
MEKVFRGGWKMEEWKKFLRGEDGLGQGGSRWCKMTDKWFCSLFCYTMEELDERIKAYNERISAFQPRDLHPFSGGGRVVVRYGNTAFIIYNETKSPYPGWHDAYVMNKGELFLRSVTRVAGELRHWRPAGLSTYWALFNVTPAWEDAPMGQAYLLGLPIDVAREVNSYLWPMRPHIHEFLWYDKHVFTWRYHRCEQLWHESVKKRRIVCCK